LAIFSGSDTALGQSVLFRWNQRVRPGYGDLLSRRVARRGGADHEFTISTHRKISRAFVTSANAADDAIDAEQLRSADSGRPNLKLSLMPAYGNICGQESQVYQPPEFHVQ